MRIADIQAVVPGDALVALLVFGIARGVIPPAQQGAGDAVRADPRDRHLELGASTPAPCARRTLVEKSKV